MKHPTTRQTREQRASVFFALYAPIAPNRSIEALQAICTTLGLRVSLRTLKAYSVDYHWQDRVAGLDAERKSLEDSPAGRVARMNERQAHAGEVLTELALEGASKLKGREAEFSPQDVARLLRDGTHAWRLALGEATSRTEVEIKVYSELVEAIALVFLEANPLPTEEGRARRFALGAQALIEAHMAGNSLETRNVEQGTAGPRPDPADTA